jgi:hypothetical protein
MALADGPFSRHKGRIGNIVYGNTLGGNAARTYQPKPRYSNTPGQQKQRSKHTGLVRYARQINTALKATMSVSGLKMSAYNRFYKLNVQKVDDASQKWIDAEIENIQFSVGTNENARNPAAAAATGAAINLTFANSGYSPATNINSVVYWYAYNVTKDVIFSGGGTDTLSSGATSITGIGGAGDVVRVFVLTINPTNGQTSDSSHVASVTLT